MALLVDFDGKNDKAIINVSGLLSTDSVTITGGSKTYNGIWLNDNWVFNNINHYGNHTANIIKNSTNETRVVDITEPKSYEIRYFDGSILISGLQSTDIVSATDGMHIYSGIWTGSDWLININYSGSYTINITRGLKTITRTIDISTATQYPTNIIFPEYIVESGPTAYTFNLGSVANPDSELYDGVYESNNNGVNSSYAVSKITFKGYPTFNIYIRSYAQTTYDYVVASKLDAASYPTSYSNTYAYSNANTRGKQTSGTALSNYTKVSYENDGGEHFIYVVYLKNASTHSYNDKGYFFIEK